MRNFQLEQRANGRRLRMLLSAWFGLALLVGVVAGRSLERFVSPADWSRRSAEPGWAPPLTEDYTYRFALGFLALAYVMARRSWRASPRSFLVATRARPLEHRTTRNVAEEIALAAGLPPPDVYVVEDPIPNAFALGVRSGRGTVVVTRGLLEKLDRDELQAVLAHEIGHLRCGDARLMTALLGLRRAVSVVGWVVLGPLHAARESSRVQDGVARSATAEEGGVSRPLPRWWPTDWPRKHPGLARMVRVVAVLVAPILFLSLFIAGFVVAALALKVFPFVALAWAGFESLRRETPSAPPPASNVGDRTGPRVWLPLLGLFLPIGLVAGPAILVLGALFPLAAAIGRVVVSRNRELDADVAAVELTRNPESLLSALQALRRHHATSRHVPRWLTPLTIVPVVSAADGGASEFVVRWREWWSGSPSLNERIERAVAMTLRPPAPERRALVAGHVTGT